MNTLVKLVCPRCKVELVTAGSSWKCSVCASVYPHHKGVVNFLGPDQTFNEGAYGGDQKQAWGKSAQLRERIHRSRLLSLLNDLRIRFSLSGRRDRVFVHEMGRRGTNGVILDLGCGAGRHYFCNYGKVVGIDPVLELLLEAQKLYSEVYRSGGFELPFANDSFDYVVSSDVLGHIKSHDKDRLFAEMYRVLKKGGRTVHVIETDSTNRWFKFAHKYPELFQRYFVDRPGHFGLELPTQLRARFLKHGFKEVAFKKMSSNVPEVGFLTGCFDNDFKDKSSAIRFLTSIDRVLVSSFAVRELLNFVLEPIAWLDDHLTPFDCANGALVVYEK